MKTIKKLCFATTIIVCAAIYSSQKQKQEDAISPTSAKEGAIKQTTSKKQQLLSWQPDGSKFEKTENGYILSSPSGWAYAGFDQNGNSFNILYGAGKTISCTCNNTSGRCKPFDASGPGGTISGCGGPCTDCTMKQSVYSENNPIDILTGGYYEVAASTKVLKKW